MNMTEEQNAQNVFVTNTIHEQLGARRFDAMTGAYNYVRGMNDDCQHFLSFKLPTNLTAFTNKANFVRITLINDVYEIEFGRIWGMKYKTISVHEMVYVDSLRTLFESETGLRTSL